MVWWACVLILCISLSTTAQSSPAPEYWSAGYQRPQLPLDDRWPKPNAFPFQLAQPFGSVPLAHSGCCPFSNFPLPLPKLQQQPRLVFLLGPPKSGTTALYQLLSLHPQIDSWKQKEDTGSDSLDALFKNKEPHFMAKPPLTYADVQEYLNGWKLAPPGSVWLDATPGYFHLPVATCRIRAAFPDARFIISLRDPLVRSMSQYKHEGRMSWNKGVNLSSFSDRVAHELSLLERKGCMFQRRGVSPPMTWTQCFRCYLSEPCQMWSVLHHGRDQLCNQLCSPGSRCDDMNWMLMKGMYAPIIANWLRFFPADQIYVVNMDDQVEQLPDIFRFLGLPPINLQGPSTQAVLDRIRTHSATSFGSSTCAAAKRLPRSTLEVLSGFYDQHNAALYQLLNMMGLKFREFNGSGCYL